MKNKGKTEVHTHGPGKSCERCHQIAERLAELEIPNWLYEQYEPEFDVFFLAHTALLIYRTKPIPHIEVFVKEP